MNNRVKPSFITKVSSLFRIIATITCNSGIGNFLKTGIPKTREEMDGRHSSDAIIELMECYNDDNPELDVIELDKERYANFLSDVIPESGVLEIKDFDLCPSPNDFEHCLAYLKCHYNEALRRVKKSGNHDDFHMFVGEKPFLIYYHDSMADDGNPHISNFVTNSFPVFDYTSCKRIIELTDDEDNENGKSGDEKCKYKNVRQVRQSKKIKRTKDLIDLTNESTDNSRS